MAVRTPRTQNGLAVVSLFAKESGTSTRPWRVDRAISVDPRPRDARGREHEEKVG